MLVFLLALVACDPTVAGRVCLIGDSLSLGVLTPLHFELSAGYFVDGLFLPRERSELLIPVASTPGARLDVSVSTGWVAGRLATSGVRCDQAVISFGTNDIVDPGAAQAAELDALMDALLGLPELEGVPVLWMAPSPTSARHPQERVWAWRIALWRAEQRWPLLEVQDTPTRWLGPDGVHYTPDGYAQLAHALAERLLVMVP